MYEVELKLPADHDAVRERLAALGAREVRTATQRDTYYDAPHRDFAATDEAFRLREETDDGGTVSKLTYKGPLVDAESKTREEHETAVADGDAARAIAEGLGFEPAAVVEKERVFYETDGFVVTLDTVTGLGTFVEAETEVGTEAEVPAARDRARELLADLGLDPEENVRTSYLGLLFEAGAATAAETDASE
ncbi:class IV adenylate cyclase [Halosegnis marinus]|uniref:Class IV adenylate cyclase n=1 Tax=Halosegnis marinus TaxID=3034023 RepID=A0ABD5ZSU8_9EURY|nr:class IV adenylate cyclase [Halosegnis sp. DT85]